MTQTKGQGLRRWGMAVAVASVMLAGCSSSQAEPSDEPSDPPETEDVLDLTATPPTVSVIEGGLTVVSVEGVELDESQREAGLEAGTVFTTDSLALVELEWADGSVTRLGPDTELILWKDGTPGTLVRGVTWNRTAQEGAGKFRHTLADATVLEPQGTGFVVDCRGQECLLYVFEGAVNVHGTPVDQFTWAQVSSRQASGLKPLRWSDLFMDEWVKKNMQLDTPRFVSVADLYASADPSLGSIGGSFEGTVTVTEATCDGACATFNSREIHVAEPRNYSFEIDCSQGLPCQGMAVTEIKDVDTAEVWREPTPVTYDGNTLWWSWTQTVPICVWDEGIFEGYSQNTIRWEVTPTAAAVIDGDFVVTAAQGVSKSELVVTEAVGSPECVQFQQSWSTVADMDIARAAVPAS